MWVGHLGRINIAKHRIEILSPGTAPVHLAPYRAGPKTLEFKKVKTDKMLSDSVIDLSQTELAAHIEFVTEKTKFSDFVSAVVNLTPLPNETRFRSPYE